MRGPEESKTVPDCGERAEHRSCKRPPFPSTAFREPILRLVAAQRLAQR